MAKMTLIDAQFSIPRGFGFMQPLTRRPNRLLCGFHLNWLHKLAPLRTVLVSLIVTYSLVNQASPAEPLTRPNIVLILADDKYEPWVRN